MQCSLRLKHTICAREHIHNKVLAALEVLLTAPMSTTMKSVLDGIVLQRIAQKTSFACVVPATSTTNVMPVFGGSDNTNARSEEPKKKTKEKKEAWFAPQPRWRSLRPDLSIAKSTWKLRAHVQGAKATVGVKEEEGRGVSRREFQQNGRSTKLISFIR